MKKKFHRKHKFIKTAFIPGQWDDTRLWGELIRDTAAGAAGGAFFGPLGAGIGAAGGAVYSLIPQVTYHMLSNTNKILRQADFINKRMNVIADWFKDIPQISQAFRQNAAQYKQTMEYILINPQTSIKQYKNILEKERQYQEAIKRQQEEQRRQMEKQREFFQGEIDRELNYFNTPDFFNDEYNYADREIFNNQRNKFIKIANYRYIYGQATSSSAGSSPVPQPNPAPMPQPNPTPAPQPNPAPMPQPNPTPAPQPTSSWMLSAFNYIMTKFPFISSKIVPIGKKALPGVSGFIIVKHLWDAIGNILYGKTEEIKAHMKDINDALQEIRKLSNNINPELVPLIDRLSLYITQPLNEIFKIITLQIPRK